MTRAQHVQWCKDRALAELQHAGPSDAVASMLSDMGKHDDTAGVATGPIAMMGMMEIAGGPDAVRRWIEGFN